jgi:hypothetical protein
MTIPHPNPRFQSVPNLNLESPFCLGPNDNSTASRSPGGRKLHMKSQKNFKILTRFSRVCRHLSVEASAPPGSFIDSQEGQHAAFRS